MGPSHLNPLSLRMMLMSAILPKMKYMFIYYRSWEYGEDNGNPLQCFFQKNPMDRKSLVGCSPWDHKESDMTEWLSMHACHHLGILSLNLCFVSEVWWNNEYKKKYMQYVCWLFPITPSAHRLWCPVSTEFWRTRDAEKFRETQSEHKVNTAPL